MRRVKKGFTLVELLVVIAIIAILAAIIAPNAFKAIEKSKVATAESDYRAVKTATLGYYSDMGKWPAVVSGGSGVTETGLFVTGKKADNNAIDTANWNGPYLEKWPSKNPWGGSYKLGDKTLILDKVAKTSAIRIQTDLGSDIVSIDSDETTVTITIAK